jgi:hypothetical protein
MNRCFPFALLVLFVAASTVVGQRVAGGIPVSPPDGRNDDRLPTEEQKEFNRHVLKGDEASAPEGQRGPRLAEAQIREDFRRLQIVNNQLQASAARGGAQDQALIKPLDEIRKRARRLKANLVLAAEKGGGETPEPEGGASLEALLGRLDESVKGFVRNPMFGSAKVLDVELSKKARADLERVIELSRVIADRLRKGSR